MAHVAFATCALIEANNHEAQVEDYKQDSLNFVGKVRTRTSNELLKVRSVPPPLPPSPRARPTRNLVTRYHVLL